MEFSSLTRARYSVRTFKSDPVPREIIERVLETARWAPTACNFQPQRILVVDEPEVLAKIRACTQYQYDAPCVMLVCYNRLESWKRSLDDKDSGDWDAAVVATHLLLAAANEGLGAVWVGYFHPRKLGKALGLPYGLVPVAMIPMGWPTTESQPSDLHSQRKSLERMVVWNHF